MFKHIHESNLIENIDDVAEDAQSMYAWNYLKEQAELSHGVIMKVQKIITLHQYLMPHQRGYYRDLSKAEVMVGSYYAPHSSMVRHLMENWLLDYKVREPLVNHIAFEKIHPFVDGNGRTGRMLMWWQEIKDGKKPTLFKNATKFADYYPLFR